MGSNRTYLTTRILPLPEAEAPRESPRLLRWRDLRAPALPPLRRSRLPSPRRRGRESLPPTISLPGRAPRPGSSSNAAASARKRALCRTPPRGPSTSSSPPSPPGRGERPSSRATASEPLSAPLSACVLLRACWPPNAGAPTPVSSPIRASSLDRARSRSSFCRRLTGRFSASLRVPPFLLSSPLQPPSPTGVRRGPDHTIPSLSRRVETGEKARGKARSLRPFRR